MTNSTQGKTNRTSFPETKRGHPKHDPAMHRQQSNVFMDGSAAHQITEKECVSHGNYFGAVSVIKGAYDLLEKKHGSCVAVSSNIISQDIARMDIADLLNNSGDDEHKIRSVVSSLDASDLSVGNSIYAATKYALARWVRRHSASYAANGVRINAVAPGNVGSAMTATMSHSARASLNALPIPTRYGQETFMDPKEIALAIVFLASEKACGINGIVLFVDGGTDALLNTEKVY